MARVDLLSKIISQNNQARGFNFDLLTGPRILDLVSPYDVQMIDDISRDPRLVTKLDERIKMNDDILGSRGFVRITQGTNRAVYKYLEDQSFVFKVAISVKGREDSPKEMYNQRFLRPIVTKCFDVSPTGVLGSFERVEDITSQQQFYSMADNIFDLIMKIIQKGYVMGDIGTNFFRNYGIRLGFGPVLLDYPLLYKIDGNKLYCNRPMGDGTICGGEIDFDIGFNHLYCSKCGIQYTGKQIEKKVEENLILIGKRRTKKMKIEVYNTKTGEVVKTVGSMYAQSDQYIDQKRKKGKKRKHDLPLQQPQVQTVATPVPEEPKPFPADQAQAGGFPCQETMTIIGSDGIASNTVKNVVPKMTGNKAIDNPLPDILTEEEETTNGSTNDSSNDNNGTDGNDSVSVDANSGEQQPQATPPSESDTVDSDAPVDDSDGAFDEDPDIEIPEKEDPVDNFLQKLTNVEDFCKHIREDFSKGEKSTLYFNLLDSEVRSLHECYKMISQATEEVRESVPSYGDDRNNQDPSDSEPKSVGKSAEELSKEFENF